MNNQPMMLQGKLLKYVKAKDIVHGTLRLPNDSTLHLVLKNTDCFIQLGQVLVSDAQPHVSVIATPTSYHKPGVGNVTFFEVQEIKAQSDLEAVINQVIYLTSWLNKNIVLPRENTLLTNNKYHDTMVA